MVVSCLCMLSLVLCMALNSPYRSTTSTGLVMLKKGPGTLSYCPNYSGLTHASSHRVTSKKRTSSVPDRTVCFGSSLASEKSAFALLTWVLFGSPPQPGVVCWCSLSPHCVLTSLSSNSVLGCQRGSQDRHTAVRFISPHPCTSQIIFFCQLQLRKTRRCCSMH